MHTGHDQDGGSAVDVRVLGLSDATIDFEAAESTPEARRERARPGVLVRCAADGELRGDQQPRLAALMAAQPELGTSVESEQSLRAACGRVMGGARCPEELRRRVQRLAEESRGQGGAGAGGGSVSSFEDALERRAESTRSRSFWSGRVRALSAAAAVLLVAGGAVYLSTQSVAPTSTPSIVDAGNEWAERVQLASSFLAKEHSRCFLDPAAVASKFTVRDAEAVPDAFEALTGLVVNLGTLLKTQSEHGLRFVDAGQCSLPGDTPGMHMRFARHDEASDRNLHVSLFVQPASDWLSFEDGHAYRLTAEQAGLASQGTAVAAAQQMILAWQQGGLVHYLVADEGDVGEGFREQFGIPKLDGSF